jgi:hypothetical protein
MMCEFLEKQRGSNPNPINISVAWQSISIGTNFNTSLEAGLVGSTAAFGGMEDLVIRL